MLLATVGAFTAAYGGVVAASQTDVKKLLVYLTMSHSGFLWFLAAVGQGYPILIYLYLHGLFKGYDFFFCAGAFIRVLVHKTQGEWVKLIFNLDWTVFVDSLLLKFSWITFYCWFY